jgi:hypothetical protein
MATAGVAFVSTSTSATAAALETAGSGLGAGVVVVVPGALVCTAGLVSRTTVWTIGALAGVETAAVAAHVRRGASPPPQQKKKCAPVRESLRAALYRVHAVSLLQRTVPTPSVSRTIVLAMCWQGALGVHAHARAPL